MAMRNIKVSVIMACHNSSAYLDEAVRSVLCQDLRDLELIIVDDCSSDNTRKIAKHYQVHDGRVSVTSLPVKSGPAIARNSGIQVAKGEWIGILDSDDVAMLSRFKEQMIYADKNKDLSMIGSNSISIDSNGNNICGHKYPTNHNSLCNNLYSLRKFPPHSSMIYRKDLIKKLGIFNPRYLRSQDFDLWLRLSEVGRVASIDKPLVKIRKHGKNISNLKGGMIQALYGYAALICHFLRVQDYHDPSIHHDEANWEEFLKWCERRMMEEGIFNKQKAWKDARDEYFAADYKLLGAFRFGSCLLQSGYACELVWNKYFGSTLPVRLAQEWIKRSNAVYC